MDINQTLVYIYYKLGNIADKLGTITKQLTTISSGLQSISTTLNWGFFLLFIGLLLLPIAYAIVQFVRIKTTMDVAEIIAKSIRDLTDTIREKGTVTIEGKKERRGLEIEKSDLPY